MISPMMANILDVIRDEMDSQGLTQTQLAERMGKTKGHVNQVLSGRRSLTIATIEDVEKALGCKFLFVKENSNVICSAGGRGTCNQRNCGCDQKQNSQSVRSSQLVYRTPS